MNIRFNMSSYKVLIFTVFIFLLNSCHVDQEIKEYPDKIGDIAFDPKLDDPNFKVCDEDLVVQHYAPYYSALSALYEGDKPAIERAIRGAFPEGLKSKQSGYITIRFIVNCKGETGRYRPEQMSLDYKTMKFAKSTFSTISNTIKNLDGWMPMEVEGRTYDYYVYVSVKIENGEIINILP